MKLTTNPETRGKKRKERDRHLNFTEGLDLNSSLIDLKGDVGLVEKHTKG
jgi:hypothetical protein